MGRSCCRSLIFTATILTAVIAYFCRWFFLLRSIREVVEEITPRQEATPKNLSRALPRVLAIVFPQFHQDPLNDKLWGEGFTDWNNLRAAPTTNRLGFAIPRPTELGYYDYTDSKVRKLQGDLARQYGIDGFVYHHYWFYDPEHPGPTLHAPLMKMLNDGHPDMPFCLHWCEDNWIDTWMGITKNHSSKRGGNVLQKQYFPNITDPTVADHYKWLRQFFHHPNYIKIHGQPVLMVYKNEPESFSILKHLRQLAKEDGLPGLYIAFSMVEYHYDLFPARKRYSDGLHSFPKGLVNRTVAYPYPLDIMSKKVLQVPDWCQRDPVPNHEPGFQVPGILTSFDNTPRRDLKSATLWSADEPDKVIERFSTSLYAAIYYETCCFPENPNFQKVDKNDGDQRLILINAMNEWAEGMALEPSDVFGRRFLEAVRDAKGKLMAIGCTPSVKGA